MNKMTYYWANGEVVARSYKHFFDRGARFEAKDPVTNLHRFCITSHHNFGGSNDITSDIAYQVQELVEEYGSISVTVENYRGVEGLTMKEVVEILMKRDGLSRTEAQERFNEVREMIRECNFNPVETEDILIEELGLEMDYIFEFL